MPAPVYSRTGTESEGISEKLGTIDTKDLRG